MSPTLTAKSRAEPGVAGALRPPPPSSLSGLGVWEQALTANTTANAAAMRDGPASHLDSCILMFPLFPRCLDKGIRCANGIFAASPGLLVDGSFKNVTTRRLRKRRIGRQRQDERRRVFPAMHTGWRAGATGVLQKN